jgi:hypothetical protein
MSETALHPLAADYLKRLRDAARSLPRSRRDDLLADIQDHLAEAAPAGASEADVRTALDRLGDPDQIVAAEQDEEPLQRRGVLEWGAIILLLAGGVVVPVIGWIVGAVLLWISRAWTLRDKIWGTLVIPGGLLPAVWIVITPVSGQSCSPKPGGGTTCIGGISTAHRIAGIVLFIAGVVLPIVTAVYLARRARRPAAAG